jgi:hypothetical protein
MEENTRTGNSRTYPNTTIEEIEDTLGDLLEARGSGEHSRSKAIDRGRERINFGRVNQAGEGFNFIEALGGKNGTKLKSS